MSRRRRTWCLPAAVLALLLGTLALSLALAGPKHTDPGPAAVRAATGAFAPEPAPHPAVAPQKGPACAPAGPDRDGVPGVPVRAGGEHAQLSAGTGLPEGVRPQRPIPARALVRGPDRAAPGPVELAVMRV
ncbi:hypothetical protein ACFTWH_20220 [Streptomyces sp. NPDC057011]|uniref:hypothetical protein n=1 Tax=unclassified Streptomyces TaxID=2593676 RepID=UPI0036385758